MSQPTPSDQSDILSAQAQQLFTYISQAATTGVAIHQVEATIWDRILAMGQSALGLYLSVQGTGDVGETIELETGETVKRLPAMHRRGYQSVFGLFEIDRTVYGSREGQKIAFVPLDNRLQLPESKFSYLLQDWSQHLVAETPYGQVNATLGRILGFTQSSDSLERMNRQMSESVETFEVARPAPPLATDGQIIVTSADGKGVPIQHSADTPSIAGHRPQKGPKPNRKKMAIVGAVYTIEPRVRTPEDVIVSLFRAPTQASPKPLPVSQATPLDKHLKARLTLEGGAPDPLQGQQIRCLNGSAHK